MFLIFKGHEFNSWQATVSEFVRGGHFRPSGLKVFVFMPPDQVRICIFIKWKDLISSW